MGRITAELLDEVAKRIVETVRPEKIILFGSYAWGNPDDSSDIDLFIVLPSSEEPAYRRARLVYKCLRGIGVPVDVVVQTHAEAERGRTVAASLVRKVFEHGKVIYG